MNANELADYLDNNVEAMIMSEQTHIDQAATMLRQQQAKLEKSQELLREYTALNMRQQAEIEALKLQLHTTLTNRNLEKPAKYSDAWWKEAEEFNKMLKAQEK